MRTRSAALSISSVLVIAVTSAVVLLNSSSAQASSARGWCVRLDPIAPATYCQPFGWNRKTDVLTAGSTYDRAYWDWPGNDARYSYVKRALADHRATLAYDRVSTGPSETVTVDADASQLHRAVQLVRLLGARRVTSVSHSLGSGVALAEAAKYHDVDALVLTGYLHRPSNPLVSAGNWQANLDPKYADSGLDDAWITTRPGTRLYGFHSPTSDLDVVEVDEHRKGVTSRTELLEFLSQRGAAPVDNISRDVRVPVLVLVGQRDAIFCLNLPAAFDCADQDVLIANEAPYYRTVTVASIVDSGHDLALHPTGAGASYEAISTWLGGLR